MFKKIVCINIMLILYGVFGSEIILEHNPKLDKQLRAASELVESGNTLLAISKYRQLGESENIKYRFLAANGLLNCRSFDDAAQIYSGMSDISTDIDLLILAAAFLADCGYEHKEVAKFRLLQISHSTTATESQKIDAKWYLDDISK